MKTLRNIGRKSALKGIARGNKLPCVHRQDTITNLLRPCPTLLGSQCSLAGQECLHVGRLMQPAKFVWLDEPRIKQLRVARFSSRLRD